MLLELSVLFLYWCSTMWNIILRVLFLYWCSTLWNIIPLIYIYTWKFILICYPRLLFNESFWLVMSYSSHIFLSVLDSWKNSSCILFTIFLGVYEKSQWTSTSLYLYIHTENLDTEDREKEQFNSNFLFTFTSTNSTSLL